MYRVQTLAVNMGRDTCRGHGLLMLARYTHPPGPVLLSMMCPHCGNVSKSSPNQRQTDQSFHFVTCMSEHPQADCGPMRSRGAGSVVPPRQVTTRQSASPAQGPVRSFFLSALHVGQRARAWATHASPSPHTHAYLQRSKAASRSVASLAAASFLAAVAAFLAAAAAATAARSATAASPQCQS